MPMNDPAPMAGLHDDLDIDSAVSTLPRWAQGMGHGVQAQLVDLAEDGKRELARSFDGLVTAAHELAARVDSMGVGPLSKVAWQAAGVLSNMHQGLRDRPVDTLLDEGRLLIRREPAVAVGVAVAAGFLAVRLFKASSAANGK